MNPIPIARLSALTTSNTCATDFEVRENPVTELFTVWTNRDGEFKLMPIGPFITIRGALKYAHDAMADVLDGI